METSLITIYSFVFVTFLSFIMMSGYMIFMLALRAVMCRPEVFRMFLLLFRDDAAIRDGLWAL
jgi:uncharacterized membrane protein YedE/YeeE